MSCNSTATPTPYMKRGDTFSLPVKFKDSETGEGIPLSSAYTIECVILLPKNIRFTPSIQIYPNQLVDAGRFILSATAEETALWDLGVATMDIKITYDGSVRHSDNFSFKIVERIT